MAIKSAYIPQTLNPTIEHRWYLRDLFRYGWALFAIAAMYTGIRLYQGAFALETGLDSTMPIFDVYWRRLFYIEIAVEIVFAIGVAWYLWRTRDPDLDRLSTREEIRRYFTFVMWGGVYGLAVYWAGSYFGEQDNAWHQAAVRDTPFTPNHIVVFYLGFPLYTILGMATWLYARTRLPLYAEKISLPLTLAVAGPFMLLPSVGYNEWGHTFWYREELFAAPVHYGFVLSVWFALALAGTILQMVARMSVLLDRLAAESASSA
jgi:methane/ammonia monooxygenase subunit C